MPAGRKIRFDTKAKKQIAIRFTPAQYEILRKQAINAGLENNISEYTRSMILDWLRSKEGVAIDKQPTT